MKTEVKKGIQALKDTLTQIDLSDIYKTFYKMCVFVGGGVVGRVLPGGSVVKNLPTNEGDTSHEVSFWITTL